MNSLLTHAVYITWENPQRKVTQSGGLELWLTSRKKNTFLEKYQDKGKQFKASKANCEKENIREETKGVKFVYRFLWCHIWADKSLSAVKGEFIWGL